MPLPAPTLANVCFPIAPQPLQMLRNSRGYLVLTAHVDGGRSTRFVLAWYRFGIGITASQNSCNLYISN